MLSITTTLLEVKTKVKTSSGRVGSSCPPTNTSRIHVHMERFSGTETRDSEKDSCTIKVMRTIHTEVGRKGRKAICSDLHRWGGAGGHPRWEVTWAQKSSLESEFGVTHGVFQRGD